MPPRPALASILARRSLRTLGPVRASSSILHRTGSSSSSMNYSSSSSSHGKGQDAGRDQLSDGSTSSTSSIAAAKPSPAEFLPAPTGGPSSGADTPVLDVSGAGSTISLDAMGPVVVNKDGTVARVGNWAQMTEPERQTTLRVLGKRNQQRLAALREAGVELKGMPGGGSTS